MSEVTVPEPVAAFIAAINAGDEDAFLDAFTTGGFVDDWGRIFADRAAIKAWSDREFLGAKGKLTPTAVTTEGSQITVIGDWRSNHANGLSAFTFEVDTAGTGIASMTIREG